jgi:hypothetical protein
MTAVAVELPLELEARPLGLLREPDEARATTADIEPWELHSELVLVCPEVCARALELLPERDPDAFLVRREQQPFSVALPLDAQDEQATGLGTAVVAYALWRIADTAQRAVIALGLLAAVALLAEVVH